MLAPLLMATLAAQPSLPSLRAEYLDGLFRSRPHLATFMGDHRHEAELMDLSDAGSNRRVKELESLNKRLDALARAKLSADDSADAQILSDGIALELLYLREIREFSWNPRFNDSFPFYDPREMLASRLETLIHGTFAPEQQRHRWVLQQLRGLPKLLTQQQKLLTQPSLVHLEQAIKENRGRIEFFNSSVKEFTQKNAEEEKARLAAVKALEGFQSFLEKFPREKATHEWKLGAELYAKKFPLALQTNVTPEQLEQRARETFAHSRKQLYELALKIHAELWPKQQRPSAQADSKTQAALIRRVQDELSKEHPKSDELVKAHTDKLASLRAFIEQKDLIALPPEDTLKVQAMPDFKRGGAGAEYLSPGMLDKATAWKGTFYVDTPELSWPAEKLESYLRANDSTAITLTSAHEAYPGHHLQAWYAHRDANPLRSTLWSGAFAEGWAVYGENLLVNHGFGGAQNNRFRFREAKSVMVVAANAILDIRLQTGRMTDEEALRFMVEEGFQEPAQAERKLLRAKLDSTQLCQYFLGYSEILELERDVRAKGNFNQRAFNEALVGHGTVPVKILRGFLLPAS